MTEKFGDAAICDLTEDQAGDVSDQTSTVSKSKRDVPVIVLE